MERLQKVIAACGICSRRKAEELIRAGKVKVNGTVITELGYKVSKQAEIQVDDKPLKKAELFYFLLNKPKKVICSASDQFSRQTVVDLIECPQRIYPVGRLDYDTTGALLLTNDGEFANELTHPRYHLPKCYIVNVKGLVSRENLKKLTKGVKLDDGDISLPAQVKILDQNLKQATTRLELTIFEGKNHQVKRMMEAIGCEVSKLHRQSIGSLNCDKLPIGSYRRLKPFEIKQLKTWAKEGREQ